VKIIFLDFDGVLNCRATIERADRATEDNPRWHETHVDLEMVERLNDLLKRSNAHVVVSSSWRLGYDLEELKGILHRRGLNEEHLFRFISVTPKLRAERGYEIQEWLDGFPITKQDTFVILDDDSDMAHLIPFLVHTSFEVGLTDAHVEAALAVLGCMA
jgi:hypothetical protein